MNKPLYDFVDNMILFRRCPYPYIRAIVLIVIYASVRLQVNPERSI